MSLANNVDCKVIQPLHLIIVDGTYIFSRLEKPTDLQVYFSFAIFGSLNGLYDKAVDGSIDIITLYRVSVLKHSLKRRIHGRLWAWKPMLLYPLWILQIDLPAVVSKGMNYFLQYSDMKWYYFVLQSVTHQLLIFL